MKEKMSKKDISKGEFQHQMFKLLILLIAFIFICLIGGFIYITLSSSSSKNSIKLIDTKFTTEESFLNSNEKYYKIILNIDKYNHHLLLNNSKIRNCSNNNFYKIQIYNHLPCNSNNNNISNIINKYLELISKENINGDFYKIPKSNNKAKLFINNSGKKIKILLAPISQIKYLNLKNDINERKNGIYYEFILDNMNYIYIPSYYFIQIKEKLNNFSCYEYQDLSFINDIVFKILYK
jgi:hypothetical protein